MDTEGKTFLKEHKMEDKMNQAVHIVWATGGSLVPEEIREQYKEKSKRLGY